MELINLKSILFIFLEIYTIRCYTKHSIDKISYSRDLMKQCISECLSYKDFRKIAFKRSLSVTYYEWSFILGFLTYLKNVDKIIKM